MTDFPLLIVLHMLTGKIMNKQQVIVPHSTKELSTIINKFILVLALKVYKHPREVGAHIIKCITFKAL